MSTRNRAKVTAVPKLKKKVAPKLSTLRPRTTRRNQSSANGPNATETEQAGHKEASDGSIAAASDSTIDKTPVDNSTTDAVVDNGGPVGATSSTGPADVQSEHTPSSPPSLEDTSQPQNDTTNPLQTNSVDTRVESPPKAVESPPGPSSEPPSVDRALEGSPASTDSEYQPPTPAGRNTRSKTKTRGKRARKSGDGEEGVAKKKRPSPSKERKAPDRATMTMQELIYYNPTANPMQSTVAEREKRRGSTAPPSPEKEPPGESEAIEAPESSNSSRLVPQLRIAADGSIIIDETSMTVSVTQGKSPSLSGDAIVEMSGDLESMKQGTRVARWSQQESNSFFKALGHVGTDFAMMTLLLPNRSRKELKNKFKREERQRPQLVAQALRNQLKVSKVSS